MEEEAEDWLNDLGLREFVPKFKSIGIMEIDDFCSVDGSHLDEMGLTRYQVLNVAKLAINLFFTQSSCTCVIEGTRKFCFLIKLKLQMRIATTIPTMMLKRTRRK